MQLVATFLYRVCRDSGKALAVHRKEKLLLVKWKRGLATAQKYQKDNNWMINDNILIPNWDLFQRHEDPIPTFKSRKYLFHMAQPFLLPLWRISFLSTLLRPEVSNSRPQVFSILKFCTCASGGYRFRNSQTLKRPLTLVGGLLLCLYLSWIAEC